MTSAFLVRAGGIKGPGGSLLRDLNFSIPAAGVTVILGPAGCGKSKLLQALDGTLPDSWRQTGEWLRSPGRVEHLRQSQLSDGDDFFERSAGAIFLDETDRAVGEQNAARLAARIREHGVTHAVVLVTHNLSFARSVADHVILLCDGTIVEDGDASSFFNAPRHDLARRFVQQGNCWPGPRRPELPSHFHWILPGQLSGMGRPGLLREEEDDLFSIAEHGISLLVSLTEKPFPPDRLRAFGIAARHFPIDDMGTPTRLAAARLCRAIEKTIEGGGAVAVHCLAGLGRTGTMLAAYLVWKGMRAEDAIGRVRGTITGAIQTAGQARFVREFEELG